MVKLKGLWQRFCVGSCLAVLFSGSVLAQNGEQQTTMAAIISHETIVLGAGCFWGVEKRYQALPGVIDAVSGYADGRGVQPNYRAITAEKQRFNPNNFAEVVQVTFNPNIITTEQILQFYFEQHDPTQKNRQGNDVGTQYRSIVLFTSVAQQQKAVQLRDQYQQLLKAAGYGDIVTEIKALTKFYPAEDYHQDYLAKNPEGYCPDHATGVRFASSATPEPAVDNSMLLQGQHIVVIDAPDCPYCEQFKKEVANDYQGTIPMHFRSARQLQGLQLKTPTFATPTILFFTKWH